MHMTQSFQLPPDAQELLQPHFTTLDLALIRFRQPVPALIRRLSPFDPAAIAFPAIVYVATGVFNPSSPAGLALIAHELEHVAQWRRHGRLPFLVLYLTAYIRGRCRRLPPWEAYRAIGFEVEARAKEDLVWKALSTGPRGV